METPLVTIMVPCYGQVHLLGECLDSLLDQEYTAWEALVIDDASPGGGVDEVVHSKKDSRIRLVSHTKNRGLGAARNSGARAGTGELLLPIDSDDCLKPTYLSTLVPLFIHNAALDCAFTDFELFGTVSGIWEFRHTRIDKIVYFQWIPGPGVLMRRRLWERVGGYCEADVMRHGNEDWGFWLAATESGFRFERVPLALYRYRRHGETMVKRLKYFEHETRLFLLRRYWTVFAMHGGAGRFVGGGYFRAARAALRRGEILRAGYRGACGVGWRLAGTHGLSKPLARLVGRYGQDKVSCAETV